MGNAKDQTLSFLCFLCFLSFFASFFSSVNFLLVEEGFLTLITEAKEPFVPDLEATLASAAAQSSASPPIAYLKKNEKEQNASVKKID